MLSRRLTPSGLCKAGLAFLGLALLMAGLMAVGRSLHLMPIDFGNYLEAADLILADKLPYGETEFFAPPWIGVLFAPLLPLPPEGAAALWLAGSLAAIGASTALFTQRVRFPSKESGRLMAVVVSGLLPASVYVYITGQITGWVLLALVAMWLEVSAVWHRERDWVIVVSAVLLTAKPHLVLLPAGLCLLTAIRTRRWRTIALVAGALGALALLSFVWSPQWLARWVQALMQGDFRGGAGLAARGFLGYRELGLAVVWVIPLIIYVGVMWAREGASASLFSLATAVGLMLVPYSRAYDYVLLFPGGWAAASPGGRMRGLRVMLAVVGLTVVSVSRLSLLTPPLICLALLLHRIPTGSSSPASLAPVN